MQPEKRTESVELSAQELAQVSGGAYNPDGSAKEGSYKVTGRTDEYDNLSEWVDGKLQSYSDQYGYGGSEKELPEGEFKAL